MPYSTTAPILNSLKCLMKFRDIIQPNLWCKGQLLNSPNIYLKYIHLQENDTVEIDLKQVTVDHLNRPILEHTPFRSFSLLERRY